jgi:hypothetical protein
MSYGIYGGRKDTSVFLRTYRTTTTLSPLIYFNGLSAALTFSGTLDSQDLLTLSNASSDPLADYARAERLCAWASARGVAGFVRTNAGFELLWCDMRSPGLKLVRNVDVTRWADDMDDHSDRRGSDRDGERGRERHPRPPEEDRPRFPGPGRRPPGGFSMFARYASWEWLRAVSHTYDGLGEARVQLFSGWHVTSRGIASTSGSELALVARMASLPNDTVTIWREEIDSMLNMVIEEHRESSGVDWRALTDVIVGRYGDRLPQLRELLDVASQTTPATGSGVPADHAYTQFTNTSTHLQHAYRLVSSLVLPFFDHDATREVQVDTCTSSILPDLVAAEGETDSLNSYERKLWAVITFVHRSICSLLIDVHAELTTLRPHWHALSTAQIATLTATARRVEQLTTQLDWSMWVRCPDMCAWGQVCYIPIWPLFGFGVQNRTSRPGSGGERPEPQCADNLNHFD